jgi:hypothetical protein
MSTAPSARFALPGRWVKAELDDPDAVAALQARLPEEHQGGTWLEPLRAAGAQTLLLRPSSDPPTAIIFVWPEDQSHGDASLAALRERSGLDGEPVEHRAGYATVRRRETGESPRRDLVTYALAHPESGRVLVVRCIGFDGHFEDYMVDDIDLAAGDLTWDET